MSMSERIKAVEKTPTNTWKPEKAGDYIAGTILDIRLANTIHGERLAIDIESEKDNLHYCVWGTTVIKNELQKKGAAVGDTVGIKFVGQVKNYKSFVVLVEKNDQLPF